MILLADSGSTKCDWALIDSDANILFRTTTAGLNPNITSKDELEKRIVSNENLREFFDAGLQIDFFGSGCGAPKSRGLLEEVLNNLFSKSHITVKEDTVGAVLAVTSKPGIICILGTGSNSCFFDGENIHHPIASLGYVLMDEAGANFFGKQLINDFYYKRMPENIAKEFQAEYDLSPDEILKNLYKKPLPGVYLASFSKFIFEKNTRRLDEPYFSNLIKDSLEVFIKNRILTFENVTNYPIHFVGSISFYSKKFIEESFEKYGLQLGNVVRYPIDGLIDYYKSKLN